MDSILLNNFSLEILNKFGPIEKVIYRNSNYYSMSNNSEYKLRLGNRNDVRADTHVWIDGEKVGVWRINPHSRITIERPANFSRKFTLLKEGSLAANDSGIKQGLPDNGLIKVVFKPEKNYNGPIYGYTSPESTMCSNCSTYTDGVTPSNKKNRVCALSNTDYNNYTNWSNSKELSNFSPGRPGLGGAQCPDLGLGYLYQNNVEDGYYLDDHFSSAGTALGRDSYQRFRKVTSLTNIDENNVTTIYTRLIIDNDSSTYRRPYVSIREAKNTNIPPRLELRHPVRPHGCNVDSSFTLSEKKWFDNF